MTNSPHSLPDQTDTGQASPAATQDSGRRRTASTTITPEPAHRGAALVIVPVTLAVASRFVCAHHRHLKAPPGHRLSIGVARQDTNALVGVAIVGRPIARAFDDGSTAELTRLRTDSSTVNAASMLIAASWRAARAIGYRRLISYTRADEAGTSLRAAGWHIVAQRRARTGWNTPSRPRAHRDEPIGRTLWQAPLRTSGSQS